MKSLIKNVAAVIYAMAVTSTALVFMLFMVFYILPLTEMILRRTGELVGILNSTGGWQ